MNAFQLLKSGASFSRKRVEKIDILFKKDYVIEAATSQKFN